MGVRTSQGANEFEDVDLPRIYLDEGGEWQYVKIFKQRGSRMQSVQAIQYFKLTFWSDKEWQERIVECMTPDISQKMQVRVDKEVVELSFKDWWEKGTGTEKSPIGCGDFPQQCMYVDVPSQASI